MEDGLEVSGFIDDLMNLGLDSIEEEITEWLESDNQDPGYAHLDDDDGIISLVTRNDQLEEEVPSDEETDNQTFNRVNHKDAMECLINVWIGYNSSLKLHPIIQVS